MTVFPEMMKEALIEARRAAEVGEVPVGAVVAREGEIVSRARNEVEESGRASAHAELLALERAAEALHMRSLTDCVLYVTMEPCPMCAGACLNYRIGAVVFGAFDGTAGALGSVMDMGSGAFGREIPVYGGFYEEACARLLTDFFKGKR